ncbi:MAG: hypothetical protein ACI4F7_06305 [Acutalibacteraceae bacterium]
MTNRNYICIFIGRIVLESMCENGRRGIIKMFNNPHKKLRDLAGAILIIETVITFIIMALAFIGAANGLEVLKHSLGVVICILLLLVTFVFIVLIALIGGVLICGNKRLYKKQRKYKNNRVISEISE